MAHRVEIHALAFGRRQQNVPLRTLQHGNEVAARIIVVLGDDAAVAEAAVDTLPKSDRGVIGIQCNLVHVRLVDEEAFGRLQNRQILRDPFSAQYQATPLNLRANVLALMSASWR